MSKKPRFRGCFNKQYGKRVQTLLKAASRQFYHVHWSLAGKFSSKKSLFLTWQIFGLLVTTFATYETYPVLNRDNLTIPIEMQLSEKEKSFSQFFPRFLKSMSNFAPFEEKYDPHSFLSSNIRDTVKVVR